MSRHIVNNPQFRPPAEAFSLVLQVDQGCPYNRCTFCGMYRDLQYRSLSLDEIRTLVTMESCNHPDAKRIFLADGDVMRRPFDELMSILELLNELFPRLRRVNMYANGSSIGIKSERQLIALRALKLHTLYMGLESANEGVLSRCCKNETAMEMVAAGIKARECGLRMSVMVLLGLGGVEFSAVHAEHTAEALNRMQPRLLSALRVIPVEGTELYAQVASGQFCPLTEYQVVSELRNLLSGLEMDSTVFRANHSSNVVHVEGRLPHDKERLLADMNDLLESDMLDQQSPGVMPLWL